MNGKCSPLLFFSALYNDLSVWRLWGSFHFWEWLDLKCATNNITAAQKAAIFRCVFCNLNNLVWLQYNKKKPISWFCDFHFFIWHINLCFSYLYFCFDWILLAYFLKQIFLVWFIFLFKHVLVLYSNQWWPASPLYIYPLISCSSVSLSVEKVFVLWMVDYFLILLIMLMMCVIVNIW